MSYTNKRMGSNIWKSKIHVFLLNLGISLFFSLLAAILLFLFWYPSHFDEISGGRKIFLLVVSVDVVLGPLITLIVFHPKKSCREKKIDFSIIAALQIMALCYGLWMAAQARPVAVVFEYDRFRVVHASEIPKEFLAMTSSDFQELPWTGPNFLSLRTMGEKEKSDRTVIALGGISLSAQADLWQSYEAGYSFILQASLPASRLLELFPEKKAEIEKSLRHTGLPVNELAYIPLVSRSDKFWTAIISNKDMKVVAYLPLDSF